MDLRPFERADWKPLPGLGCIGVEDNVVLTNAGTTVSMMRFANHAAMAEGAETFAIDVACIVGRGLVSVGDSTAQISAGQTVRWPAHIMHRLWTDDSTMMLLMVEFRAA